MATLTRSQLEIVKKILEDGKALMSKETSDDYATAAAFVFDNGCFFMRYTWLEAIHDQLKEDQPS